MNGTGRCPATSNETKKGDNLSLSERMQGMTFGQKLGYLWYYYKWPAIITVVVVVGLVLFVKDWFQGANANIILNVTMVNADTLAAEETELFRSFPADYGYDPDETVYVESNLLVDLEAMDARSAHSYQILAAEFVVGEIDLFISDPVLFQRMAENGGFTPLPEVLSEAQLAAWADRLQYFTNPKTGETYPIGLILPDSPLQREGIYEPGTTLVAGIAGQARHPETAVEMLHRLSN